ncbi:sphingosine 1-phosphate receptor 3-like [Haliotis rufescens]|uniref:sphingosine 1-phosphate receptor 3-like n=2 Tax=Haliotis TaxID=6452 RepID=UPI00201F87A2|nr:sphingosine 1-phosphate receptor 3-like [Haliotis rufescens]
MYIPLPPTLGLKDVMNADNATITALGEYPLILFSCVYFNAKDVLNDFPLSHNILVYIIPSCLLLIINILIVKNLRTAQSITSSRNPAAELAKRRLIKSVVAISCMSLIAYPTSFLMFFISQYHVTSEASQFSMMMFIEDMVHALNSSINCLLYCLIGKRFRSVFMKLLCGGCRRRQSRPQRAPVYVISSNDKSSSTRH